jgi:hypothetical protein
MARIALDQLGKIVHRERRRVVHLMLEADRLMTPQFGVRLVPFAEDLARRHCRTPPDFLFSVGSMTTIPGRFFSALSQKPDAVASRYRQLSRYETTGRPSPIIWQEGCRTTGEVASRKVMSWMYG